MKKVSFVKEKLKNFFCKNWKLVVFLILFICLISIFSSKSSTLVVDLESKKSSYKEEAGGSFHVSKSAEWIRKGKARITFEVDTKELINKNATTDVILIIDSSSSMVGNKLDKMKRDSIDMVNKLLDTGDNRISIINFNDSAQILTDFSNNKFELENKINSLNAQGETNYYQALVEVDKLLSNYKHQKDRKLIALFLTDGYPSVATPNEVAQYNYLKSQYSYLNVRGIQYEMGDEVVDTIKQISDEQYISYVENLDNILIDAIDLFIKYEKFEIIDYINEKYFDINSEKDITVSTGNVKLDKNSNSKIVWDLSGELSGKSFTMMIDISLKDKYLNNDDFFETNSREEVISIINGKEEKLSTKNSPILTNKFNVTYESNAPEGGKVKGEIPAANRYSVFETVKLEDEVLTCDGYQFAGWEIVNKNDVQIIGDDYFRSNGNDVTVRATWTKINVQKSMEGTVHEVKPVIKKTPVKVTDGEIKEIYQGEFWSLEYRAATTKIVIQNQLNPIDNAYQFWDVSEAGDSSVMAYAVLNDDGKTFTIYLQGDDRVIANEDSTGLFSLFVSLEEIVGLENLDTSKTKNTSFMFFGLGMERDTPIQKINVSSFDTSNVTDMSYMFTGSKIVNLDFGSFDTSNVTNMSYMFGAMSSLNSLDLSNFDTSKVVDMSFMFTYTAYLNSLDLSNFDTSNVINMSYMFGGMSSLNRLDLSNFDTSKVTNMEAMFADCTNLLNLNISSFDTSNVTNMRGMLGNLKALANLDISHFNTSKVTNMSYMFAKNTLDNLNIDSFDTSNVIDMNHMFSNTNINDLNLPNLDTSKVTDMSYMFSGSSINNLNLSNITITDIKVENMFFNSKIVNLDFSYADFSNFSSFYKKNLFSSDSDERYRPQIKKVDFSYANFANMDLTYSFTDTNINEIDLSYVNLGEQTSFSRMFYDAKDLTKLNFTGLNTTKITDMSYMFFGCSNLVNLNLNSFDTSKVTNMSSMFSSINTNDLDLSNFDTSNVTDMSYMFWCIDINTLDLSSFDTSNVTDMSYMFYGAENNTLDLSSFDTSKVTNMDSMFYGCSNLTNLDLSNFKTSNVTRMNSMFRETSKLTTLNLSNFSFSKVTRSSSMYTNSAIRTFICRNADFSNVENWTSFIPRGMAVLDFSNSVFNKTQFESNLTFSGKFNSESINFSGASFINVDFTSLFNSSIFPSLKTVDFSKAKFIGDIDFKELFYNASNLVKVDFSNTDTTKLNSMSMSSMFRGCSSLTSVNFANFDTSKVTYMALMFSGCSSLTSLDLSSFNTSGTSSMIEMFQGCTKLVNLNISNLDTSKVTRMNGMFKRCTNLENLNLSNFDTSNVTDMSYMFQGCTNLVDLNLSSFDTSKVTDMRSMFYECNSLKKLDFRNAEFNRISYNNMFSGMTGLTVYVKDKIAKDFIDDKLYPNGTAIIVE